MNNRKATKITKNFGGRSIELWCGGGEVEFIEKMIGESLEYKHSCLWFSTLISKQSNLKNVYAALKSAQVIEIKTILMKQGSKITRLVA